MGRWLGVDYGTRRVGTAAGTEDPPLAAPLKTLPAESAIEGVAALAEEYRASGIVVGLPVNMDGTEGPMAADARAFAAALARRTALPVRLWDERLSSFAADDLLAGHLTRNKRRRRQDSLAAATVLQDFLDAGGAATAETVEPAEL